MSDTATKTYTPKGITRASGNGNGGDTEWLPLPEGRYVMYISKCTVKDPEGPPRRDKNGKELPQYQRVVYQLSLSDEDAKRLKERVKPKLAPGQEQSVSAWFTANYTWGWFDRQQIFHETKLFSFATDCAGFLAKADAKAWLTGGGALDPEWFVGMVFRGIVEHERSADGRIWVTVKAQSLDEYEESNRNALVAFLRDADPDLFERLQDEAVPEDEVRF